MSPSGIIFHTQIRLQTENLKNKYYLVNCCCHAAGAILFINFIIIAQHKNVWLLMIYGSFLILFIYDVLPLGKKELTFGFLVKSYNKQKVVSQKSISFIF